MNRAELHASRVDEALRLHGEGLTINETAKLMGLSHETVRRYLRGSGIPFIRKPTNKGSKKYPCGALRYCPSLIRMLVIDGASVKDAAKIVGCQPVTVSNFKSRHGMADFMAKRISMETKNEIVIRAKSGESYYSIGEDLGINHSTVSKIARANGVHRGKGNGCASEANAKRHSEAKRRMSIVLSDRFEVIDLKPGNRATLRCKACGDVFERTVDYKYMTTCFNCERIEAERKAAERKAEAAKRSMRRQLVKAFRKFLAYKKREQRINEELDAIHVCKECGREFTMRELREINPWNYSDSPTFCSLACSHRYHGRKSKHMRRQRARVGGCSMSLRELDERDGHTCYLCGGTTDWDDYKVDASGNFIAGDRYPSMDHVIPFSNGGTHTPDNLKIAHRICNSLKGDRTIEEAHRLIAARLEGVPS